MPPSESLEEFEARMQKWLSDQPGNNTCGRCGHTDWRFVSTQNVSHTNPGDLLSPDMRAPQPAIALVVRCGSCGRIEHYDFDRALEP